MAIFTYKTRYVNPEAILSQVNDAMSGGVQQGPSGVQTAKDPGQLGGYYYLTALEASSNRLASLTQPLYEGLYQYVKLASGSSTPALGQAAFWDQTTNLLTGLTSYTVTLTEAASGGLTSAFAGVFLNAITPGNYGWVQVGGVATVAFVASLTGAASIGAVVAYDFTNATSKFDLPTQTVTAQPLSVTRQIVGRAIQSPTGGANSQILLGNYNWSF